MNRKEMEQEIEDLEAFIEVEREFGQVTPHIRKKLKYLQTIV